MSAKVFLLALVVLGMAQPNYQKRFLHYGNWDNPCAMASGYFDDIKLVIYIPGHEPYEAIQRSYTFCHPYILKSPMAINPSTYIRH